MPRFTLATAATVFLAVSGCDSAPMFPPATADASTPTVETTSKSDGWEWVSWEGQTSGGMTCRSGTKTGYGRRSATASPAFQSDSLLIVLQGGGWCDASGCSNGNASSYGRDDFFKPIGAPEDDRPIILNRGIFFFDQVSDVRTFDRNPFSDAGKTRGTKWDIVFVPYCTGDFHMGSAEGVTIPGESSPQSFVGYDNLEVMLDDFGYTEAHAGPAPSTIVLAGVSAGGFGTAGVYGLFADRFAGSTIHLLDDSGPFLPYNVAFGPNYQNNLVTLWEATEAFPSATDCPDCWPPNGTGSKARLDALLPYYVSAFPTASFGVAVFDADAPLRTFFGTQSQGNGVLPEAEFREGLARLRTDLDLARDPVYKNAGTFYMGGEYHGSILKAPLYDATRKSNLSDTLLTTWIGDVIDSDPAVPHRGTPNPTSP